MRSSFLIAFSAIVAAGLLAACTIVESDEPIDEGTGGTSGVGGSSAGGSAQGGAAQGGAAQGGAAQGGAAGEAGAATGGAAGEAGAAGAAGSGNQDGAVGKYCEDDSYCLPGLKCIVPSGTEFFGGGPANGYCTVSCTADANACAAFTGTNCVDLSITSEMSAWCLQSCAVGQGDQNCYGRIDVACSNLGPLEQGGTDVVACVPVCATDSDCGGTLVCDKRTNMCTPQQTGGTLKPGAECDPANNQCEGTCLSLPGANNTTINFCTQRCVYGNQSSCGEGDSSLGLNAGICNLVVDGDSSGDEAYCQKYCDAKADCAAPGLDCDLTNPVNGYGLCYPVQQ